MNHSEQINELAAAFAKAQASLPAVPKRGHGQVGQARTTYATLDDVIDTVRGPLSENGLSFTQMLDNSEDGPTLTTMLLHESGQWIVSSTPIDAMDGNRGTNAMQAFGSTLTYLKRYALSAMLGVTTGEDDDGASAHAPRKRTQHQAKPAQRDQEKRMTETEGGEDAPSADLPPDAPVTSWSQFKDFAVNALGYSSGTHLVNALREERGTDKTDIFWKGARPMIIVDGEELVGVYACPIIWKLAYEHKQA